MTEERRTDEVLATEDEAPYAARLARARLMRARWIVLGLALAALVVVAGLIAVAYRPIMALLATPTPRPTSPAPTAVPPTPTSIVRPGPIIVKAIRSEAKLETYRMTIVNDQDITRPSGIGNICTERIVYLGYYDVTAGVDLSKISEKDIASSQVGDNMTVTITLPPAEIVDVTLDTVQSRLLIQETPKWIPGCETQVASMTLEAQQRIRDYATETALSSGILAQAQEKAGFVLQRLLYDAGFPNVIIKYSTPDQN